MDIIPEFICRHSFLIALFVFAFVNLTIAYQFLIRANYYGNLKQLTDLPRAKWKGYICFAVSFIWLVPHIADLFGPDSAFVENYILHLLALAAFILICMYADFLFARGICILLIFCSYVLLQQGFAAQPPFYEILAILFFVPGVTGIVIAARPVLMRDWLVSAVNRKWVRLVSGIPYLLIGLAALGEILLITTKR